MDFDTSNEFPKTLVPYKYGEKMKKNVRNYSFIFAFVALHVWQASLVRPVADDYTSLRIYSEQGFWVTIQEFWMNFGGNLSAAIVRLFFISISSSATNWIGFILYSLATSILVTSTYLIVYAWMTNRNLYQLKTLEVVFCMAATFAFEGLFTPGLSSIYLFGASAGVHVWPLCILVITLFLISRKKNYQKLFVNTARAAFIFTLGFIVGNSGMAEGAASLCFVIGLLLAIRGRFNLGFGPDAWRFICTLLTGIFIGFVTNFIAPGFQDRLGRDSQVLDESASLLTQFRSSIASFTGELITHPIWILFVLLFIQMTFMRLDLNKDRGKLLVFGFITLYFFTVLGSTFGYAAWHQSGGLLLIFTPFLLALASVLPLSVKLERFSQSKIIVLSIILVMALLFVLTLRGLFVQEKRSGEWDKNLIYNYCLENRDQEINFLGAEIRYWPLGLGIEDVNRWQWMSDDYRQWLKSFDLPRNSNCS